MNRLVSPHWQLKEMQLYRFGVFNGEEIAKFKCCDEDGSITAVLGNSGVGKSTVLDAKTILLEDGRRGLNVASSATGGETNRRSPASYVLGYVMDVEENGVSRPLYLRRRDREPAWGAVRGTFVSGFGESLDAAGFFYVPSSQTTTGEYVWVISESPIDVKLAASVAASPFTKSSIREVYPEAELIESSKGTYMKALREKFGTSARYEELAHRLQGNKLGGTVNQIFSDVVLDEPPTISMADEVVEDALARREADRENELRRAMRRDRDGIAELASAWDGAKAKASVFGSWAKGELSEEDRRGHARWWLTRCLDAIGEERGRAEKAEKEARALLERASAARDEAKSAADAADAAWRAAGGGEIEALLARREATRKGLDEALRRRARAEAAFQGIGEDMPDEEAEWESRMSHLRDAAREEDDPESARACAEAMAAARDAEMKARGALAEAKDALARAERGVRVDAAMERARRAIAEATGTPAEELPYVAELFDLEEGHEQWRYPMNRWFSSEADHIVVTRGEKEFRRALDASDEAKVGRRAKLVFVGKSDLEEAEKGASAPRPGHLSEILKFNEASPLAAWARRRLCSKERDPRLVGDGRFNGEELQLSVNAQVKHGRFGSFGKGVGPAPDFIGFADEALIASRRKEAEARAEAATRAADGVAGLMREQARLRAEHDAYLKLEAYSWEDVASERRRMELERIELSIERARGGEVKRLEAERESCTAAYERAVEALGSYKSAAAAAKGRVAALSAADARTCARLRGYTDLVAPSAELAELFSRVLEESRALEAVDLTDEGALEGARRRHEAAVVRECASLRAGLEAAESRLSSALETFKRSYPDKISVDTGTRPQDVGAYLALQIGPVSDTDLLESIHGISERLACLKSAERDYERAAEAMFGSINAILAEKPFNERGEALTLVPSFARSDRVTREFDAELDFVLTSCHHLTRADFEAMGPEEAHRVFDRVVACAMLLAHGQAGSEKLADPRRRLRVKGHVGLGGEEASEVISGTGGMNGGKAEKVTAYVLGAATYAALGAAEGSAPCFAPLVIDEAFSQSDADTTHLALSVLRDFGFQVILGAADGKAAAIMDYCDRYMVVVRPDPKGPGHIMAEGEAVE